MFDILFGWRKASKCKRLIRRLQRRLKVLKNKRSSIVKQLRDDVAELLKRGHIQTAYDRVEQLFKDECLVAVYDQLDSFGEFVISNLRYIRRNKDCPNDINEAASSLIFASARFGELPELVAIRKLFGERYGQRFAALAIELLPGNLVNLQMQEKVCIKSVSRDIKCRLVEEIFKTCLQSGPLLLEYSSELHQKLEHISCIDPVPGDKIINQETERSNLGVPNIEQKQKMLKDESENQKHVSTTLHTSISPRFSMWSIPSKETCPVKEMSLVVYDSAARAEEEGAWMPEDMIYVDEIQELESPRKNNLVDQRVFIFRPSAVPVRVKTEQEYKRPLPLRNDLQCATYYGESAGSSPDAEQIKAESSCSGSTSSPASIEEEEDKKAAYIVRARLQDLVLRSNSFPFLQHGLRHVHPNLPDYDKLAATFIALKQANLQGQKLCLH